MFILEKERHADPVGAFQRYEKYLKENKGIFPPSAYALATSGWYGDFNHHHCPHDGWLESFRFVESSSSPNEPRTCSLVVRLLGAYHDGHIEFWYPQVFSYSFSTQCVAQGHGDWRYDEFRLSESGNLIHEIEWAGNSDKSVWIIESNDLQFKWHPKGST